MKDTYRNFCESPWMLAKELARSALDNLAKGSSAYKTSLKASRIVNVNYMRCMEFGAVAEDLVFKEGDTVLDISSPQWFTICMAYLFPGTQFLYTNIIESEITDYEVIAKTLNLNNIEYQFFDIRESSINKTFDHIYSISVLEHVYPEKGGDVLAYNSIRELLNPEGRLVLTVPYKEKYNVVYIDGDVYEREGEGPQFFCREYDKATYDSLEKEVNFVSTRKRFICESKGLFSLDYYESGAGSKKFSKKIVLNIAKCLRRVFGAKFDAWVAAKYYRLEEDEKFRLVNVVAVYDRKNLGTV